MIQRLPRSTSLTQKRIPRYVESLDRSPSPQPASPPADGQKQGHRVSREADREGALDKAVKEYQRSWSWIPNDVRVLRVAELYQKMNRKAERRTASRRSRARTRTGLLLEAVALYKQV